jgi:hypothetical protein
MGGLISIILLHVKNVNILVRTVKIQNKTVLLVQLQLIELLWMIVHVARVIMILDHR